MTTLPRAHPVGAAILPATQGLDPTRAHDLVLYALAALVALMLIEQFFRVLNLYRM